MELRSRRGLIWAFLLVAAWGETSTIRSQTVVEIYQRQWFRNQALQLISQNGARVPPRPPSFLPTGADSLGTIGSAIGGSDRVQAESPTERIQYWQRIPKLARGHFERRFEGEKWVFLGTDRISRLDTMMTREIRGRLEAHHGKPTRTLADDDAVASAAAGDIFQFEYWFILDDEIPLIVTDVNGPFERGVVASTVERYGDRLMDLRDVFLETVIESDTKARFVDYYFDDEAVQWYRAGYDGRQFFLEPIGLPGRHRPVLPKVPRKAYDAGS